MNKSKKKINEIIGQLNDLAKEWPSGIGIFAFSGTLLIYDTNSGEVISEIPGIPCDGGDPGTIEKNGKEYLKGIGAA